MEALFQIGEFGHSLVHAYEGMRRHGVTFEHGIYQANATIEDCVGRNTSPVVLLLLYRWIRRMWKHRELLIGKFEEEKDEFEGAYSRLEQRRANDRARSRYHRIPTSIRRALEY